MRAGGSGGKLNEWIDKGRWIRKEEHTNVGIGMWVDNIYNYKIIGLWKNGYSIYPIRTCYDKM